MPMLIRRLGRLIVERRRAGGTWVLARVLMSAELTVPMPRIGRSREFALLYDDYAHQPGSARQACFTGAEASVRGIAALAAALVALLATAPAAGVPGGGAADTIPASSAPADSGDALGDYLDTLADSTDRAYGLVGARSTPPDSTPRWSPRSRGSGRRGGRARSRSARRRGSSSTAWTARRGAAAGSVRGRRDLARAAHRPPRAGPRGPTPGGAGPSTRSARPALAGRVDAVGGGGTLDRNRSIPTCGARR